ncbi:hypothetical protein JNX00_12060 [Hydrogenophaga sp. YM1]|uniref:hypothetical protein n=1 Tax=Hydrogenophaga sp. YM1 TaxID=2806262 RepID=UPI001956FF65|nr:hypothetical protein [Hydrogenophaga sp. YM1]QRR32425.1 hypothetical protein JNX00_12060 [Hydrogenophaga sp. YM1]
MNEHQPSNLQQYRRIVEVCLEYLDSRRSIASTIADLEGLIQALEGVSSDLKNQFLARSGVLEDIYAASLDHPELDLLNVHRERLVAAVTEILDASRRRATVGER